MFTTLVSRDASLRAERSRTRSAQRLASRLTTERRTTLEPSMKVLGADFELANAIESDGAHRGDVSRAAQLLLRQIDGLPRREWWGGSDIEWGRRFLPSNGSSAYIDSDHLEINLPEHTRAEDHPAIVFAGLRLAREAQLAATAKLDADASIN